MSESLRISRVKLIIVIITIIMGVRNLRIFYNCIYNAFIVIAKSNSTVYLWPLENR